MRGFILLSCAVCLAVARPQSGYNYGPSAAGQLQGAAQLSLPIQQAPQQSVPLGTASGQLDQATLDILRQLPLVPTSSSFLLHESHQTLTNAGSNAFGGSNAFSSGLNELNSAPIQAQFSGGISPIQVASSAQTPQQPQYSPAPQPQYAPAPAPAPAHTPAQSYGPAVPAPPAPQQQAAQLSLPIQQIPIPSSPAPAPQPSFQQFAPQPAAPQPRILNYNPAPQQAPPQAQFASLPLGPSPADIAPSHLASSSSNAAPAPSAPAAPLQLAPQQQPAPAQPSGLYPTANFPEPITTIHKHIYVHVPPPEFEEELPAPRVRVEPANNQKHVQILFIKAPAPPTPKPVEFPPLATNEEKTLVYVLVKKPEQPEEIVPPQTPETKVNKPEVFFIKYQGEKDQPQGYGSDAPSDAGSSDATITNAAALPEPRSAEPAQSAQPSEQPAASEQPSSSSSSGAPDRKYIPAA